MKWLPFLFIPTVAVAEMKRLTSPDGRNTLTVEISDTGTLAYSVTRDQKPVIEKSPLGLIAADADFSTQLRFVSSSDISTAVESYSLVSGNQRSVRQEHRRCCITVENADSQRLCIDLDAGNQGVAFRYRFDSTTPKERTIVSESSGFKIPKQATGWISPYNSSSDSSPAYEDYYFKTHPGDPPPASRGGATRGWYFPALFQIPDASWVLISETATDENYPGCHLAADSQDGIYKIEFPFADEGTQGVKFPDDTSPKHQLPWAMPWRVIVVGDAAADIANSTLITDLAPPCELENTSWIKPGRASWSWWAHPENLDRKSTEQVYDHYLKGAADFGWEYSLLDAGWWKSDMRRLHQQSNETGVALLGWTHANDFYDPKKRADKLDELKRLGFVGVKIDFWCSDRQETMDAIEATLKEAAARHLLVNLHGCPLPRGWQRTYPNLISAEAVLGTESYMFDERYPEKSAELNTILPFTRNVIAPMDFTPLGLGEKTYARKNSAAHELAAAVIFNSGIVHYADDPVFYEKFPVTIKQLLKTMSPVWDETRYLVARPGELVVVARRTGKSWVIAGINGKSADGAISINLMDFGDFENAVLIGEGRDRLMDLSATRLEDSEVFNHQIPAKGGMILWLKESD